jgi:hypothetical protein
MTRRPENHRLCWDGLVRVWQYVDYLGCEAIVRVYDPNA